MANPGNEQSQPNVPAPIEDEKSRVLYLRNLASSGLESMYESDRAIHVFWHPFTPLGGYMATHQRESRINPASTLTHTLLQWAARQVPLAPRPGAEEQMAALTSLLRCILLYLISERAKALSPVEEAMFSTKSTLSLPDLMRELPPEASDSSEE